MLPPGLNEGTAVTLWVHVHDKMNVPATGKVKVFLVVRQGIVDPATTVPPLEPKK